MEQRHELENAVADRETMYRWLSSLYFYELDQERIEALAEIDPNADGAMDGLMAEGFEDMRRYLRHRNTGTVHELAADFAACFLGAGAQGDDVPLPYESIFTSDGGLLMQEASDRAFTEFKHSALRVREGLDVPSDHLSFLLEYEAVLCQRMTEMLAAGNLASARAMLERQRVFYREHLANWVFNFLDRFESGASTRFYRGLAKITRSFLQDDEDCMEYLEESLDGLGS